MINYEELKRPYKAQQKKQDILMGKSSLELTQVKAQMVVVIHECKYV